MRKSEVFSVDGDEDVSVERSAGEREAWGGRKEGGFVYRTGKSSQGKKDTFEISHYLCGMKKSSYTVAHHIYIRMRKVYSYTQTTTKYNQRQQ